MSQLLFFLYCYYGVEPENLSNALNDPKLRRSLDELLSKMQLYRNYGKKLDIAYGGLSKAPAHKIHAFGGFMGVKLPAYFYCKYKIKLKHDHLPCVIIRGNNGHKSYIPLELIAFI